ncbi:MAG: hypothetical protein IKL49_01380 [Lachnospiraceae bacterium]|nr:hypothetical protein [Lachnospiraceae bacterium]
MISIFNRKELLITYDMKKQSEVRTILKNSDIEYKVKVKNILSPTPLNSGSRAHMGNVGIDLSKVYEYKIYAKASDYEKALYLRNTIRRII